MNGCRFVVSGTATDTFNFGADFKGAASADLRWLRSPRSLEPFVSRVARASLESELEWHGHGAIQIYNRHRNNQSSYWLEHVD